MFALGRLPGWIAHWKEMTESAHQDRPTPPDLHRPHRDQLRADRAAESALVHSPSMNLEEQLLSVMDEKDHWAWKHFTRPGLSKEQLTVHFRHEFVTYVRDFPVLLARVLGQGPPTNVRERARRQHRRGTDRALLVRRLAPRAFLADDGGPRYRAPRGLGGADRAGGGCLPRPSRRVHRLASVVRGRCGDDHFRRGERPRTR